MGEDDDAEKLLELAGQSSRINDHYLVIRNILVWILACLSIRFGTVSLLSDQQSEQQFAISSVGYSQRSSRINSLS